ncbi:MAG: AraC family transcriptional regulator [Aggregatilineales bacterium]
METIFEGRLSSSPYIESIWRGQNGSNYAVVCPADGRWNMLFTRYNGKVKLAVEGPRTRATPKTQPEGNEFLTIVFALGTFLPNIPAGNLLDSDVFLPQAAHKSFWLDGDTWETPSFENVETFVEHLVRNDVLVADPLVKAVLQDQAPELSERTLRRRFVQATGLAPNLIGQIERALQAHRLLENGAPILDAVYEAGYADQPHLTRSLKRFIGYTPAQIAQLERQTVTFIG